MKKIELCFATHSARAGVQGERLRPNRRCQSISHYRNVSIFVCGFRVSVRVPELLEAMFVINAELFIVQDLHDDGVDSSVRTMRRAYRSAASKHRSLADMSNASGSSRSDRSRKRLKRGLQLNEPIIPAIE